MAAKNPLESKTKTDLIEIIEKLNAEAAEKATEIETLLKSVEEKEAVITELLEANATINSTIAAGIDSNTVNVGGVTYVVTKKRFIHGGKTLTDKDVIANPVIAEALVKSKSPILKAI